MEGFLGMDIARFFMAQHGVKGCLVLICWALLPRKFVLGSLDFC